MAVTMKYIDFWHMTLCGSCKNRCFVGTYGLHHQGDKPDDGGDTFFQNVYYYQSHTRHIIEDGIIQ
jgi:hypothetical protein